MFRVPLCPSSGALEYYTAKNAVYDVTQANLIYMTDGNENGTVPSIQNIAGNTNTTL
jgi:hypothetical protein